MGLEGALRVWAKAAGGPARHPHAIRAARPSGPHARHRRDKPLASRALTLRALHGRTGELPPWCMIGFSWPCASALHKRVGRPPHPPGELIHPSAPLTDGFCFDGREGRLTVLRRGWKPGASRFPAPGCPPSASNGGPQDKSPAITPSRGHARGLLDSNRQGKSALVTTTRKTDGSRGSRGQGIVRQKAQRGHRRFHPCRYPRRAAGCLRFTGH